MGMFDIHRLGSASVQAVLTGGILYLPRDSCLLSAEGSGFSLFLITG